MRRRVLLMMLGAAVLLTPGCAGLHCMNKKNQLPEVCFSTCQKLQIAPTEFILAVNVSGQTVSLFASAAPVAAAGDRCKNDASSPLSAAIADRRYQFIKKFPCSTSRFGLGQIEGSNRTPLGLHRIAEKIGTGAPAGTVFQARQIVGHTSQPEFADAKITTRIFWLEGLEPGFNRDGNVDSHQRYIYIHGTADQESIGEPASCGCIHLADADLLYLFDRLPVGTLVWIAEK
jgi:hypothetical protein